MKILILDDEQLDLFVAKKLLGIEHEVEGFTNYDSLKAWAKSNVFDVALIDYYLGPDVTPEKAIQDLITMKGKTFKAFVLSSYVDERQIQSLMNAGFDGIISKPITLEEFKRNVN